LASEEEHYEVHRRCRGVTSCRSWKMTREQVRLSFW
jgi:hypothetical protein